MAKTLNVLVAGIDYFYAREIIRGIQEYSQSHGRWQFHMCRVITEETFHPFESGFSKWKPNGMLASIRNPGLLAVVRKMGLPVVNFSSFFDTKLPTVISDSVAIGQMAPATCWTVDSEASRSLLTVLGWATFFDLADSHRKLPRTAMHAPCGTEMR